MKKEIIISGFGGQGVMSIGKSLIEAGMAAPGQLISPDRLRHLRREALSQFHRIDEAHAPAQARQHSGPGYGTIGGATLQVWVVAIATAPGTALHKHHRDQPVTARYVTHCA